MPYINLATNEKVQVLGIIHVKADVARHKVNTKFYLVPGLHTDFVLGLDWLQANEACIRFGSGTLSLDPRQQLATSRDITIPSQSEQVVIARTRAKLSQQG